MNKSVFDQYQKLQENERTELKYTFRDSPKALMFIQFIEGTGNRNFKSQQVVSLLYANEEGIAYSVLENRFFKLRKKILDAIASLRTASSGSILTAEEQVLHTVKNITFQENKEEAYCLLLELERTCWERNIFELLPSVIDQLIFYNQIFNRHRENEPLFVRLERANQLLFDVNKVILLARRIYELNYRSGIKGAKKELSILKDLALKHKGYPRFTLCYHHISLYYKLGSSDYLTEMQVISRHLSEFKKLYAQHALVPLVTYKVNYEKIQHFHFNQSILFYYFNQCDFQEAFRSAMEMWALINESGSIFRTYKTESLYSNFFSVCLMAEKYEQARQINDAFIEFLKENHQQEKLPHAYTQRARLFANMFPEVSSLKTGVEFLFEQVDSYLRQLKKSENSYLSLDQVMCLKLELYLLMGEDKKALQIGKDPQVKAYLSALNLEALYSGVMEAKSSTKKAQTYKDLMKEIDRRMFAAKVPGNQLHLRWLRQYCKLNLT